MNVILETIFTKIERALVSKNKRFALNQSVSEESGVADMSTSIGQQLLLFNPTSKYHATLLENSAIKKVDKEKSGLLESAS